MDDDQQILQATAGQLLDHEERTVRTIARNLQSELRQGQIPGEPADQCLGRLLFHPRRVVATLAEALFQELKAIALRKKDVPKPENGQPPAKAG